MGTPYEWTDEDGVRHDVREVIYTPAAIELQRLADENIALREERVGIRRKLHEAILSAFLDHMPPDRGHALENAIISALTRICGEG